MSYEHRIYIIDKPTWKPDERCYQIPGKSNYDGCRLSPYCSPSWVAQIF